MNKYRNVDRRKAETINKELDKSYLEAILKDNRKDEMETEESIKDLPLATTLVAFGYKVKRLDGTHPKYFVFDRTPELLETIDNYWADKLEIEPQKLFNAMSLLKSRLYQ